MNKSNGNTWAGRKAGRHYTTPTTARCLALPSSPAALALRAYNVFHTKWFEAGTVVIHVFPAKSSGHSADFRRHLAALIVGEKADNAFYPTDTAARLSFEGKAAGMGWHFTEVDPSDY